MVLRLFGAALIGEGVWRRMKTSIPEMGAMVTSMVLTNPPSGVEVCPPTGLLTLSLCRSENSPGFRHKQTWAAISRLRKRHKEDS